MGGLTGGLGNASSVRSFAEGFIKGAAGGVIVFGGKRLIAEETPLALWSGRQLSAFGASQVRNAMTGKPMLGELIFPLGPTRLYVRSSRKISAALKLDLATAIATAVAAAEQRTSFDLKASLHNGAIVFAKPWGSDELPGSHRWGVVVVEAIPDKVRRDGRQFVRSGVTAHELSHAAQYDMVGIAWSGPLEGRILAKSRVGRRVLRYVDVGVLAPVWSAATSLLPNSKQPWEQEAAWLSPGW